MKTRELTIVEEKYPLINLMWLVIAFGFTFLFIVGIIDLNNNYSYDEEKPIWTDGSGRAMYYMSGSFGLIALYLAIFYFTFNERTETKTRKVKVIE